VSPALHAVAVVLLAIALDLALGDPPNRWHPVAWMGRVLAGGRARWCHGSPLALLVRGGALTLGVVALAALGGAAITLLAGALGVAGVALEAIALKSTLALRGLAQAARDVATALAAGELDRARQRVGFHLVSRATASLDASQVASAAIESVAENLADSFVAPLLFYLVLGLPGAFAYRALNTADTMLGYHDGPLEYFGKLAARLDDLANLIPAPMSALAIVLAAAPRIPQAWRTTLHDFSRTSSPNAGWPMSAAAGALDVTLEKPTHYRLGTGRAPEANDIHRALTLIARATALATAAAITLRLIVWTS
jgi:adenosylcobinamide-phosphate synthase